MCNRNHRRGRSAFTLIELLLVMVILGVLAAIIVPNYAGRIPKAKIEAAKQDIAAIANALATFEVDNGRYPTNDEGLAALSNPPSNLADTWHGPYVTKPIIKDPWGNPYVYHCPGSHNPRGFDLLSMGQDGQEGGTDDIDNWSSAS
ncbi:MAG TPA: type II secretion system major pseudopilin GspG [Humisphaera sp.]|jgi:general secretion pathway protein G|nr:type II secretion system major pseudopilin GspG [Humisphaera sp.]